jgi:hypothetical protein
MNDMRTVMAELVALRAAVAALEARIGDNEGDFIGGSLLPPPIDTQGGNQPRREVSFEVYLNEENQVCVRKGYRSNDFSDWWYVPPRAPAAWIPDGVVWTKYQYMTGEWTEGYGTPPVQDKTCRVWRLAATRGPTPNSASIEHEEEGNQFVIDIFDCGPTGYLG